MESTAVSGGKHLTCCGIGRQCAVLWKAEAMPELLTANEAAAFLKLHSDTVKRKAREGELPAAKIGRQWRFDVDELREWLRNGGTASERAVDAGLARATAEAISDPGSQQGRPLRDYRREQGL